MHVSSLKLLNFRSYAETEVDFAPGLTAVVGVNGAGKTNLLEAIGLAAGLGSLRGAPDTALIREGSTAALVRCEARLDNGRDVLIEAEIARDRPNRLQINRQRTSRRRDLLEVLTLTVFSPADLDLVKGEPAGRRRWLDDSLATVRPANSSLRGDLDRILRQRNALLRQAGGRATSDVATTLDVWDQKLAEVGQELRTRRQAVLEAMEPRLAAAYGHIAQESVEAGARYVSSWGEEPLGDALVAARQEDLRRAATTVGPHRDDVALWIGGLPARSHASQGEQRSLALAMRLAIDSVVRQHRDVQPVLLLDDVFSELDNRRAAALLDSLPEGQRILTTASGLPPGARPDRVVKIEAGVLHQGDS